MQDLITLAAVLVALAALWFARLSTKAGQRAADAAERAAVSSEEQAATQRDLLVNAAQPYVWVDLRPDPQTGQLLTLVVGNSGPTVATNVTVTFEPSLDLAAQGRGWAPGQERLLNGIASLPPGRTIAWSGGVAWEAVSKSGANRYMATVRADGPFGTAPGVQYVIDLNDIRHSLAVPPGTLHGIAEAVKALGKSSAALPPSGI